MDLHRCFFLFEKISNKLLHVIILHSRSEWNSEFDNRERERERGGAIVFIFFVNLHAKYQDACDLTAKPDIFWMCEQITIIFPREESVFEKFNLKFQGILHCHEKSLL